MILHTFSVTSSVAGLFLTSISISIVVFLQVSYWLDWVFMSKGKYITLLSTTIWDSGKKERSDLKLYNLLGTF